jgi:hypothetical protein
MKHIDTNIMVALITQLLLIYLKLYQLVDVITYPNYSRKTYKKPTLVSCWVGFFFNYQ